MKIKLALLLMMMGMILPGLLPATEILTQADFTEKAVAEEHFVKLADNFLVLFDASNSMKRQYKKGAPESRYEIARNILREKISALPHLGFNAGLYLYTPYSELEPMGSLDRDGWVAAVDSMPASPSGRTFLAQSLKQIEPVLQGLSGKTIVFIFSDGQYTQIEGIKQPEQYTEEFASKYNACFYVIGAPQDNLARKRLEDLAKANECSQVISFSNFIENPMYTTGALYKARWTERVETISEAKALGMKVRSILFDFDKSDLRQDFVAATKSLGDLMRKYPTAYVLLEGHTDGKGSEEYNLELSLRRAESVANYLRGSGGVSSDRIIVNYFGKANPVASNDTEEGRQLNRRVEIVVGGVQ